MLDDLKLIHERDAQDTLGIAEKTWQQLDHTFTYEPAFTGSGIEKVIYTGMGGSSLAALLVHTWPTTTIPFEVVQDYDLPAYVDDKTLVVAASYSGNTEEALTALAQAEARGAQIAVIAAGGQLADIARDKGYPLAILPRIVEPRYAVFYNLKALATLLRQVGACHFDDHELTLAGEFLSRHVQAWVPTVPTADNWAKQIALECIGKSVVMYGGPKMAPAAYKWKISFNENAKQIAWVGRYPEFNHNEFLGWTKQPVDKPYTVIDLRSSFENDRVQKRFEVTERLLSGLRPAPIVVQAMGDTLLEQLLWTINFGDFVTLYTAILNGVPPAPVELIEKFKAEMKV